MNARPLSLTTPDPDRPGPAEQPEVPPPHRPVPPDEPVTPILPGTPEHGVPDDPSKSSASWSAGDVPVAA